MIRRTSQDIRRLNRFEVLRRVYAGPGAMSRQDVAAATGLSFATVANLTAELLEAGVLVEAGHEESGGGRPRARLAVNAERGALIGVDIAETSVHAELFDLALTVRHSVERPLPPGDVRPADVVDTLAGAVEELLAASGTDRARILGAGVSVPGMVEREGGVSSFSPYWSWHEVPLRALLDERLGLPLWLDNPLRASTVAEMWFGAGREVDDLVVLTLRAGVGAGIAIGGQLYRGFTNSAGEWGHTCLALDGRLCTCGNRGCVEAYVSLRGIAETWRELAPGDGRATGPDDAATVAALARAADAGDPVAAAAVDRTARYLGAAVANLVNLVNPQVVVVGNQVVDLLGERLLPAAYEAVGRHALALPYRAATLRRSAVPHNPVTRGAATFALEGFLDDREVFGPVSRMRKATKGGGAAGG
ncbi:ROK family protein [Streptomyces sp. R302]|uniref:ROK family transcriptional regulator n=1 Tax=unclassified Streptomyces TaxID=2593676 RepID=UPI00145CACAD|nr:MULTISPECIES: ROK family protein [unclassified Streptomyces]NML50895.1 ROK family protein [Streptomyces sp. R301]NML80989.1 ROK family protein [Streptomyces sp. R302]